MKYFLIKRLFAEVFEKTRKKKSENCENNIVSEAPLEDWGKLSLVLSEVCLLKWSV